MALMPVDDALALILSDLSPLGQDEVGIAEALGRVIAADLRAQRSQPAADMSAMDGYAVAAADIETLPARLDVVGESAAGRAWDGRLSRGQCTRIFTGALLPDGADTVVIQENTARDGDTVTILEPTAPGRNVRRAGFDFHADGVILPAGRRLNDRDIMLAAAANHATVPVRRRPRVGIAQTGDELVRPGAVNPGLADVIVSNVYGIAALARACGADVQDLGLVRDSLDTTQAMIRQAEALGIDVLVTSGGASVGEHDLIAPALRAEGVNLSVHKIALRPGKPLMFGAKGQMRVLGLPGNPVSAYVCALLFLTPILNALQGAAHVQVTPRPARLGVDVKANDGRRDYMRARVHRADDGAPVVMPLPTQDSAMLSALAAADCLLIRNAHAPAAPAGSPCEIIHLPGF